MSIDLEEGYYTYQAFKFSSGNRNDLVIKFKEQESYGQNRIGVLEEVESQGDEVTCHYTYRGGEKRAYIPSAIGYHTKFSVTSVSSGTENLPLMQQEQPSIEPVIQKKLPKFGASLVTQQEKEAAIEILDTVNPNEPINQAQWEAALIFLGIPNPKTFGAFKDTEVMTGIYNECRKKAQMDNKTLSNCEKAITTAKRAINEWPADMGYRF